MRKQRNARFWDLVHGSPVKITLRPGQSLHCWECGPTDEGWSSYSETWTLDEDGIVWCESVSDGRDCDGRLTSFSQSACDGDKLMAGNPANAEYANKLEAPHWVGVVWPAWKHVDASQHDYAAEAMGY